MNIEELKNQKIALLPIIMGTALIISAMIWSSAYYNKDASNSLSVTGSASMNVESDSAKFSGSFSRVVKKSNLKSGYEQIAQDLTIIKKFLKDQGINDKDVTISTVSMYENYQYNKDMYSETEYNISQRVEVTSSDVNKITVLAQKTQEFINKGVIFSTNQVEYYYSKLPELRVSLLSEAVKDAKARASKIAEATGKRVGNLKSAAGGVVQVRSANSLDISDYGMYDTSTISKNIMITVKASFGLK